MCYDCDVAREREREKGGEEEKVLNMNEDRKTFTHRKAERRGKKKAGKNEQRRERECRCANIANVIQ